MTTPSTALKTLTAFIFLSTPVLNHAKPSKLSVCPPVIGERTMMLNSVSNVGIQKRYGELCKVPSAAIQRSTTKALDALHPCLAELGVKEIEITEALKIGAQEADEAFNRSTGSRELLCEKAREEFK